MLLTPVLTLTVSALLVTPLVLTLELAWQVATAPPVLTPELVWQVATAPPVPTPALD
jgi:hypothetical protein